MEAGYSIRWNFQKNRQKRNRCLKKLVQNYAQAQKIASPEDLTRIGLSPTARQLSEYTGRARRSSFSEGWAAAFVQDKYGAATTHWDKLEARVSRGVGNPCPLLLIGLPDSIVTFEEGE